jgi:hypothetical protein
MVTCAHKDESGNLCKKGANFNKEGETKALYCGIHKLEGMIDVRHKKCIHEGCKTRPCYNKDGETKALYCFQHKLEGMVNIKDKTCNFEGCKTQPTYNKEGEKKALYCFQHKLDGMVDVINKKCIHLGCKRQPVYNNEGETSGIYCKEHKQPEMKDVINKRCKHGGCERQPTYNNNCETSGLYCFQHKEEGMVDVINKTCNFEGCNKQPIYNNYGEKKAAYCGLHKLEGMVNIVSKTCKSGWCNTIVLKNKYDGYCTYCYMHLFPDKPIARNYKTKERAVVEFVTKQFPNFTWVADKVISYGCSKKRPDLLLDLGYQVNIVEIDENKHTGYECSCENKRIMQLSQDVGHRSIVFIRFNPDGYVDQNGKKILSCWEADGNGLCVVKKLKKNEWESRLQQLNEQIHYWSNPLNRTNKMIEVVELFYDMNLEED